jgi:phosphoenolpyruvate synthase/pyruvate phosphate dikinase
MAKKKKYIYFFGEGKAEGKGDMKDLLGGKGAGLAEMTNAGIPVPPGFTITTEMCRYYYKNNKKLPDDFEEELKKYLKKLEKVTGKKFGDPKNPLLVSVRSGAKFSMPGMMDTILNLGLNDESVKGLAESTGNERFAYDAYRRFIQMFGNVVMGIDKNEFEKILENKKKEKGVHYDSDLDANDLKEIVEKYKEIYKEKTGEDFPQDPMVQLKRAINAVFESWNNPRAITYRKLNKIPDDLGTAVNIVTMVFGNMGNDSGTGVGFTRNPSTGEKEFYGEYLTNAQGEDVVAGIRTPKPISELEKEMPEVYKQLKEITDRLEKHYRDLQDFEFTIERGKLYMLQTRTGKRTPLAAVKIAVDMVKEGLITKEEAIMRIEPSQIDQLLHPIIDPKAKVEPIAKGLPASPGAASGKIVFTADKAEELGKNEPVILVREETSPDDIHGMATAKGILTSRGGMTCLGGKTLLLTDKGFLSAKDIFDRFTKGESFRILSFDTNSFSLKWKKIIAAGKRPDKTIKVKISQTGKSNLGILEITQNHKIYTFENMELIKKPISEILKEGKCVCSINKIPEINENKGNSDLWYLTGVIFTDGYINLRDTKGSVTFTQKQTKEKEEFINIVENKFKDVFGFEFNIKRKKQTSNIYKGREIRGKSIDLICTKKQPAEILESLRQNLTILLLNLDRESLFNFLAGVIDGDGTFADNRIQIFISKREILEGVIIACLRLGISPYLTKNRNIFNLIICERLEEISKYTHRVRIKVKERFYGRRFFEVRGLFSHIVDKINYKGRLKEMIKRNLLMDANKIKRDILPVCPSNPVAPELEKILNSDLKMLRVKKVNDCEKKQYVYNFEVEGSNEIDKNYIVFTENYTPVLVSNSHAAVVARGMGKPCVVGCGEIQIDEEKGVMRIKDKELKEGDWITIDGGTGNVIIGKVPTIEAGITGEFKTLMEWVDEFRKIGVRANADIPRDAKKAREFGAEGIGLCRTEHMFFAPERLPAVIEMIMAKTEEERRKALDKLLPFQKEDFIGLFKEMKGYPVIIRTLDPPLHEFLPKREELMVEIALMKERKEDPEKIKEKEKLLERVEQLHEFNPMLGHRGCRLGITYPEITEMQARAIMMAACELAKEGETVIPEIMIPLVGNVEELRHQKEIVVRVAEEVMKEYGVKIKYMVGTMIEVPRAALTADEIAKEADFFSFGTNDLTQMTLGFSRDDVGKFLFYYLEKKILKDDPFVTLDQEGVGQLVKMGIEKGRKSNPNLEVGICGEHGGDPESVKFCHRVGMNYVSCSPYRIPVAKLAAAQAAIEEKLKIQYTTK